MLLSIAEARAIDEVIEQAIILGLAPRGTSDNERNAFLRGFGFGATDVGSPEGVDPEEPFAEFPALSYSRTTYTYGMALLYR